MSRIWHWTLNTYEAIASDGYIRGGLLIVAGCLLFAVALS